MSGSGADAPSSGQQRNAQEAFDAANQDSSREAERLPPMDFVTFVLSLHHSARMHLGDAPDPTSGATSVELGLARQSIDLITLIQEKTRGNLSGEEERILEQALYDLRMRYVEVAKSQ
ncbi:MAG: DUF1844 domain-containing protein [Polyangiaceae bacterium]